DEVVEVRDMREHVVPDQEVGAPARRGEPRRGLAAEELDFRRNPPLARDLGDVRGRLDPEHRDPALDEVLEEVAVVAGDLDHVRALAEFEAGGRHLRVPPAVLEPAARIGREVGVVGEDRLRRLELPELDEEALVAGERAEREERLHRAELVLGQDVVRDWRHAEVHERVHQRGLAEAAAPPGPPRGGVHLDSTGSVPGTGAAANSSIWRSECSRRSSPAWNALY